MKTIGSSPGRLFLASGTVWGKVLLLSASELANRSDLFGGRTLATGKTQRAHDSEQPHSAEARHGHHGPSLHPLVAHNHRGAARGVVAWARVRQGQGCRVSFFGGLLVRVCVCAV